MPELGENIRQWASDYDWRDAGDEWSRAWGGTDALWRRTLMPRIASWVPAGTILEIAPGFGRWTQFLKELADELIVVDLSERCVEACRSRFADEPHISFHVNDGRSLDMVEERSVDFAFTFDSLVHAEADVIGSYLHELAAKLTPDGVAFIHHSNMGRHRGAAKLADRIPGRLQARLMRRGLLVNVQSWRARSCTAERFIEDSERAGLACISQERVNWQFGRHLIDALSVVTPKGSAHERPMAIADNPDFMEEAVQAARLAPLYWTGRPF